ncbi:hypothetical protein QTH89_21415 [Variovorax sp. J22G21]|uniref:hypothetical protein n=1 Tax=Variovorax fucosicus TaxID=3053517 RepID=UPI0025785EAC|nr:MULTISPECIES: hypothetical protein [unclassified Variovorax]MDM0039007.1 hypothetical protein [Variovorax sp. J22R193]MDM0063783.1 hypothetical protein [Variovorax sp. J22G21]
MSGFSADWLALREPFDRAARAATPDAEWLHARGRRAGSRGQALQVVDLGSGTGANLREIAPRLGGLQHWRLVDHDPQLLAALPDALAPWAAAHGLRLQQREALLVIEGGDGLRIEIERCEADLAHGLDTVPLEGVHLVTASALLDLVSAAWLDALVARCSEAGAAVWWALTVDDRITWTPWDPDDALVLAQFHAHQQRDKGFGPALGGAAAGRAADRLAAAGYRVTRTATDWQVDGSRGMADLAMLQAMVEGIAAAAAEQAPALAERARHWQARKLAQLDTLRLQVGHTDVQAWLP